MPASSIPSQESSSGALLRPLKVRTTFPFASLTLNVHTSTPAVTRSEGMSRTRSLTLSPLGEKYVGSAETRTGVASVSMRMLIGVEVPTLPARSVEAMT